MTEPRTRRRVLVVLLAAPLTVLCEEEYRLHVPAGLDLYVPMPHDNPLSAEKIQLGRRLFFDPVLSRDRSTACATCHQPEHAFTVEERFARGIRGQQTERNPPALLNRAYGRSFFWDGRAETLEAQTVEPIQNPAEMDLTLGELESRLKVDEEYGKLFEQVFGRRPHRKDVGRALAAYVRSLLTGNSAYDRYVSGDEDALGAEARLGLQLFQSKANCWVCHAGPNLTDERFHNTGVAWREERIADAGRFAFTGEENDLGAFKTPTLREITRTAPYMHDGSLATLEEVMEYYNQGGNRNPRLDAELRPLQLTPEEVRAMLAFLKSLSGTVQEGTTDLNTSQSEDR